MIGTRAAQQRRPLNGVLEGGGEEVHCGVTCGQPCKGQRTRDKIVGEANQERDGCIQNLEYWALIPTFVCFFPFRSFFFSFLFLAFSFS